MDREQLKKELKGYFERRIEKDKEEDFQDKVKVLKALKTLKKINQREWELLFENLFKVEEFVIDVIVDYSKVLDKSETAKQLADELRGYLSARIEIDKEEEHEKLLAVANALDCLGKISKSECCLLYDVVYDMEDLVINTIAEYPSYPVGVKNDIA